MKKNYKSTVNACFAGYVVQAIVNNFVPLLFLTLLRVPTMASSSSICVWWNGTMMSSGMLSSIS